MITKILKCVLLFSLFLIGCTPKEKEVIYQDFNKDWKFKLQKEETIDDSFFGTEDWRTLNVPHDWSVEYSFDNTKYNGATGFLPGGIGWYTKQFKLEKKPSRTNYIIFDGVYNNSEYWLNGKHIGERPYGYAPFYFDITNDLVKGEEGNLLKVKVDHSRYIDSRWYTGSGIYRKVKLVNKYNLHIPIWGTFVTTPKVATSSATVDAKVKVKNNFEEEKAFNIVFDIIDANGTVVASTSKEAKVAAGKELEFQLDQAVASPKLWGVNNPYLYTTNIKIEQDGVVVDEETSTLGIRTVKFDANKGFFLNGENMKIKGVCLHHDAGLVGAAVPKDVWRRRFQHLKDGGVNAIRGSHNPVSEEFIDLCDEMGILLQDEFFDEWDNPKDKRLNQEERHKDYASRGYTDHFHKWAKKDLTNVMLRDRNHPSVFQWSIGNEIEWTYPVHRHASGYFNMGWEGNYFFDAPPIGKEEIKKRYEEFIEVQKNNFDAEKYEFLEGNYVCAETAQRLSKWTKALDTTRVVTANMILPSVSLESGYGDAVDVAGFSYRRILYDYAHENYPNKVIMGTENLGQWHEWKAIMERPFVSGTFLWTGIDYMGESHGRGYPRRGLECGLLDFAGFKKPSFYMMKSLWNEEPNIFIASNKPERSLFKVDSKTKKVVEKREGYWKTALWDWHRVVEHWNDYKEGEEVILELYSNCDEIELFLNDVSQGKKKLADFDDHIYKWAVAYKEGTVKAVGTKDGKTVTSTIVTAGKPTNVKLTVDKSNLDANNDDVAHIVAQLVDEKGNPVKNIEQEITFDIDGDVKLLGVDNGHVNSVQDYQTNKVKTHLGQVLLIVQAKETATISNIKATSKDLSSNTITLNIK